MNLFPDVLHSLHLLKYVPAAEVRKQPPRNLTSSLPLSVHASISLLAFPASSACDCGFLHLSSPTHTHAQPFYCTRELHMASYFLRCNYLTACSSRPSSSSHTRTRTSIPTLPIESPRLLKASPLFLCPPGVWFSCLIVHSVSSSLPLSCLRPSLVFCPAMPSEAFQV